MCCYTLPTPSCSTCTPRCPGIPCRLESARAGNPSCLRKGRTQSEPRSQTRNCCCTGSTRQPPKHNSRSRSMMSARPGVRSCHNPSPLRSNKPQSSTSSLRRTCFCTRPKCPCARCTLRSSSTPASPRACSPSRNPRRPCWGTPLCGSRPLCRTCCCTRTMPLDSTCSRRQPGTLVLMQAGRHDNHLHCLKGTRRRGSSDQRRTMLSKLTTRNAATRNPRC
mmetsp:Transcript_69296/g.225768  ORF Transcript_69296/g.225768 Transcript_69296/m.225768 type:complete len:221 (+) Transcript_69296:4226-4888(+)